MQQSTFWDIEGNLVDAVVSAFRQLGLPTTEQFAGDAKPGQRIEVKADMLGETGQQMLDSTNTPIRSAYTLNLMVDIISPIEAYAEHRRLRGIARSKLAMPRGLGWINCHLAASELVEIQTGNSANETMAGIEDYDEHLSTLSYTVTLSLHAGSAPTS
jgi:hypothetical protein